MNLFGYDPKFKETLPLYDRFPLIFPLEPAKIISIISTFTIYNQLQEEHF